MERLFANRGVIVMARFANFLLSTVDSADSIRLYPSYNGFKYNEDNLQTARRTLKTERNSFRFAGSDRYEYTLPVEWVSSADVTQVESWWKAGTELTLSYGQTGVDSFFTQTYVRITNNQKPFSARSSTSSEGFISYNGTLQLKSSRTASQTTSGGWFILDDPVYGLLDQPYNPLF
jgi:hypothetical protein